MNYCFNSLTVSNISGYGHFSKFLYFGSCDMPGLRKFMSLYYTYFYVYCDNFICAVDIKQDGTSVSFHTVYNGKQTTRYNGITSNYDRYIKFV